VPFFDQRVEGGRNDNLARRGVCLEASTDIDGVAECGEIHHGSRSDIADERNSRVGCDADRQSGDRRCQFERRDGGLRRYSAPATPRMKRPITSSPMSLSTMPSL
jgi:hypothetical protein